MNSDPYTILYSVFSILSLVSCLCLVTGCYVMPSACVYLSLVERCCYWVKFPILTFTMVGELELPLRKDRK